MNTISMPPIGAPGIAVGPGSVKQAEPVAGSGFGEIMTESINSVNGRMQKASKLAEGLISGEHSNIHETMIAMEESSISFRMLTKVQTKVIDAYKEVMRLQL